MTCPQVYFYFLIFAQLKASYWLNDENGWYVPPEHVSKAAEGKAGIILHDLSYFLVQARNKEAFAKMRPSENVALGLVRIIGLNL